MKPSKEISRRGKRTQLPAAVPKHEPTPVGRFRLVECWLEDFKNLKDYTITFDPLHGMSILLGWNGTGKSNLFEALLVIFRDLLEWSERNRWPDPPMSAYRISYELANQLIRVSWDPRTMRRPSATRSLRVSRDRFDRPVIVPRKELPLPRFVFGYYSGPTNRLF